MVFWSRLRQSRFKFHAFSSDFKRFYNVNPVPIIANQYISSRKLVPTLNYPKSIVQDERLAFFQKVRFYAKPAKNVAAERDPSEPRMNEEISAPTIRLVVDEDKHVIVSRHEALARARRDKLDLVEVDKHGKPPVCKIFDYNKFKYLQQTKEKERSKSKSTVRPGAAKEIRFGGKIKPNDLKIKADMVKRLMEKGYRVKCTAVEAVNDDFKTLLSQFTALIDDVAVAEGETKYEKKQAFVIVRHVKFGPPKKGSGKKPSAAADASQTLEHSEEDAPPADKKSEWAAFDKDDSDTHRIFEINDIESVHLASSNQKVAPAIPSAIPELAVDCRPGSQPWIPLGLNGRGGNQNGAHIGINGSPTRPGQRVEAPARQILKQDSSGPSSQKSYGIFSVPKQEKNVPSGTAGNPRAREAPAADSSPTQGKFGIFSADKKENQAQKR